MAATSIEWADAVWNPTSGCTWASPGCDHCYAATMTRRLEGMGKQDYTGLTTDKHFNGKINLLPHKLNVPLQRKKPTRYFVNSMSDLFHKDVPDEFIDRVFAVIALCPQHTFMVLTKRPERMARYSKSWIDFQCPRCSDYRQRCDPSHRLPYLATRVAVACGAMGVSLGGAADANAAMKAMPLPNVWLGVSVENQEQAGKRIHQLCQTPASVYFLSMEPLLGPTVIPQDLLESHIDWVIAGGESGHGARPMHPDWARSLRDQCKAAGVPYFHKQNGEFIEADVSNCEASDHRFIESDGTDSTDWTIDRHSPSTAHMVRVGKKAAGRLLDGVEHNEFPNTKAGVQ